MINRLLIGCASITILGATLIGPANASSRFSADNQSDKKINVYIYSGGDQFCSFEEKLKTLSADETDSFGCSGNGNNQCKVALVADGTEICRSDRNTCSKNAIKLSNNSTLTISQNDDGEYECSISKD